MFVRLEDRNARVTKLVRREVGTIFRAFYLDKEQLVVQHLLPVRRKFASSMARTAVCTWYESQNTPNSEKMRGVGPWHTDVSVQR